MRYSATELPIFRILASLRSWLCTPASAQDPVLYSLCTQSHCTLQSFITVSVPLSTTVCNPLSTTAYNSLYQVYESHSLRLSITYFLTQIIALSCQFFGLIHYTDLKILKASHGHHQHCAEMEKCLFHKRDLVIIATKKRKRKKEELRKVRVPWLEGRLSSALIWGWVLIKQTPSMLSLPNHAIGFSDLISLICEQLRYKKKPDPLPRSQNNKIVWLTNMADTFWEIHEVRKGMWAFLLCFTGADWLSRKTPITWKESFLRQPVSLQTTSLRKLTQTKPLLWRDLIIMA